MLTETLCATETFTLKHTAYQGWSGKSFSGRRSGAKAITVITSDCSAPQQSLKAVQIKSSLGTMWLPKSVLTRNADNSITVNKGFCYVSNGLTWKKPALQGHYIGGRFGIMI